MNPNFVRQERSRKTINFNSGHKKNFTSSKTCKFTEQAAQINYNEPEDGDEKP